FYNPVRPGPEPSPRWAAVPLTRLVELDPEPLIVLTGIWRDNELDVRSMLRIETRAVTVGVPVHGTTVEVLDGEAKVIRRSPLRVVATRAACGCSCGCKGTGEATDGLVHAYLRDRKDIASVRVVREGSELWLRKATRAVPQIRDVFAECEGDTLRV